MRCRVGTGRDAGGTRPVRLLLAGHQDGTRSSTVPVIWPASSRSMRRRTTELGQDVLATSFDARHGTRLRADLAHGFRRLFERNEDAHCRVVPLNGPEQALNHAGIHVAHSAPNRGLDLGQRPLQVGRVDRGG